MLAMILSLPSPHPPPHPTPLPVPPLSGKQRPDELETSRREKERASERASERESERERERERESELKELPLINLPRHEKEKQAFICPIAQEGRAV